MPVVDRYAHFGGVARLVGDNDFLPAVCRRENKAAVFVKRDLCAVYADYAAHYTTLHCKYGKDIILRANLSEIEALLCDYPYFFIPSKGLIINFHEVDAQNADTFTMSNGSLIPISRRKAKEVTDAYSSFLFEQLRKGGKR